MEINHIIIYYAVKRSHRMLYLIVKSWQAVNKSLFSLLLAYLSPIASELHVLYNPSRQEYWCCAACSLQDSHCDQNATQHISSDHNCSASEQIISWFFFFFFLFWCIHGEHSWESQCTDYMLTSVWICYFFFKFSREICSAYASIIKLFFF